MNLKKVSLYGATLSVAMLGSVAVSALPIQYDPLAALPLLYPPHNIATPTAPKFAFATAERSAICLEEALLSTMAAYISVKGCDTVAAGGTATDVDGNAGTPPVPVNSFSVNVSVDNAGTGKLTLSGVATNIEINNTLVDARPARGIKCNLSAPKNTGLFNIQGLPFNGLEGLFSWNKPNSILVGSLSRIGVGHDWYAENIVKDFYNIYGAGAYAPGEAVPAVGFKFPDTATLALTGGNTIPQFTFPAIQLVDKAGAVVTTIIPENVNGDWGLEAILKHPSSGESYDDIGYPRSKWWQQSLHWNANGVAGGTHMKKTRLVPSLCTMELNLWGSDFASNYNQSGTFKVTTQAPGTATYPTAPVGPGNVGLPIP